ncbi:MAG TPA: hypothetical protein VLL25_20295 [Acidimicrobiales bacterium]|nr:hypothetical protein [Acidimicrobiales bacterium]
MSKWKEEQQPVEYLDLFSGEPADTPTLNHKSPSQRQTPGTGVAYWIGRSGPCVVCGAGTFARFSGEWRHITCDQRQ